MCSYKVHFHSFQMKYTALGDGHNLTKIDTCQGTVSCQYWVSKAAAEKNEYGEKSVTRFKTISHKKWGL